MHEACRTALNQSFNGYKGLSNDVTCDVMNDVQRESPKARLSTAGTVKRNDLPCDMPSDEQNETSTLF